MGDPCPGVSKKLVILIEATRGVELFIPGNVVNIYRCNGSLMAAEFPCDIPSLRRIVLDNRMVTDHMSLSYHRALLTVRARTVATRTVKWQPFSEAGDFCPCCHCVFAWMSTA